MVMPIILCMNELLHFVFDGIGAFAEIFSGDFPTIILRT